MMRFFSKIYKSKEGFTLAEVLIVVAIMSILSGFGFVAVSQYNKRLTLLEMDDTAKKIFLAAQNHLTIAESNGKWNQIKLKNGDTLGEPCSNIGSSYYVIFGKVKEDAETNDIRDLMLPAQSVNLAGDGNYAIVFDATTASIYGVYYSASSTFGNGQDGNFQDTIRKDLQLSYEESLRKDENRKTKSREGKTPLIGYYGNASKGTEKNQGTKITALQKLTVWFDNDKDSLRLNILDPNNSDPAKLSITIGGNTSEKSRSFFGNDESFKIETIDTSDGKKTTIVCDSITSQNNHFANLFPELYRGENITATVQLNKEDGSEIVYGSASSNSLFDQVYQNGGDGKNTARISNIRHLENLSTEISGITSVNASELSPFSITKAILTTDINFTNEDGFSNGTMVYPFDPLGTTSPKELTEISTENFIGIRPDNSLSSFDGNGKTLSNMKVIGTPFSTTNEGTGLFTTIKRVSSEADSGSTSTKSSFSISNLSINSSSVKSSAGDLADTISAGTLIGYFQDKSLSIKNVVMNRKKDSTESKASEVNGNLDAGGLVGKIYGSGTCKVLIQGCRVNGTRVISNSGNAGGLIGEAAGLTSDGNSGTMMISQSNFTEPVAIEPNGINDTGSYDIYSGSKSAGGLLGVSGYKDQITRWDLKITDCEAYSNHRFNIGAKEQIGGLVGGFYGNTLTIFRALAAGKYMWVKSLSNIPANQSHSNGSCAGGLIGECNITKFDISNCGAGAYVYAVGADCAGGFIGSLKSGIITSSIKQCYVGGHTYEGIYQGKTYDGTTATVGGYNVYGYTSTGGFIGYTNAGGLTVENCGTAASTYTDAGSGDKDTSNGIIGGFVGRTVCEDGKGYKNPTTFKKCYVAGKTYNNGKNADRCDGSFIGMIHNTKENNTTENNFIEDYVLVGTLNGDSFNDFQFAGKQTTSFISNANTQLSGIKEVSTSELKAIAADNIAVMTTVFDSYLSSKSYMYPLTTSLPDFANNHYDTGDRKIWYFGDWVEPEELVRTFDGDFGILYYEQVQHGDGENASTSYYYHGYVGYENNHIAEGKQQYSEIYTRKTLNEGVSPGPLDDRNALPVGHDEYVVEQGYMILVRKTFKTKHLKLDLLYRSTSNSSAQTLEQLIADHIVVKEGIAEDGKSGYYSNAMNFEGFDCYFIVPTQDLGALYPKNNKTQLRFVQTDNSGNCDWSTAAKFAFNPMFSDISIMNGDNVPVSTVFKVRSAETLYNLFTTNYLTSAEWNGDYHVAINLDISYNKSINFKKFDVSSGKPTDLDLRNKDVTLNEFHLELYSELYQALRYKLDYLTAPLFVTNNNGNLHDMRISHYNPSENNLSKPLFGSCSNAGEKINHILIENTSGPILGTAKGLVENIEVQNMTIEGEVDARGLLISDVEDGNSSHKVDNIKIDNLIVKDKAQIGKTGVSSGVVGIINNGKVLNLTINNVDVDGNAAFHGRQWGIIGEIGSGGSLNSLHMSNVNLRGSTSAIKGENQNNSNNKTEDIRIAVIGSSLGKVTTVDINNYQCPSDGFIIENGYNSVVDGVVIRNLVSRGNGFAGYSDGTIQNSYIINGSIGESGFIDNNAYNGKVINCQIYSDTSSYDKYTNNIYLYDVLDDIKGYELVRIGIDPFSNSREKRVAGFVYQNRGNITKCSVTASVFGKNMASGFVHEDKQQTIENCYANTVIDCYGNGFGFCYRMINDNPTIKNCHSLGIINISDNPNANDNEVDDDKSIGSAGFVGDCDNDPHVINCYTAVWSATRTTTTMDNNQRKVSVTPLSTFYNFVRNAGGSTKNLIQNCSYLTCPGIIINNNDQKGTISGLKNVSPYELKAKTEYGQVSNNETVQYKQYFKNITSDSNDAMYSYPQASGLKAYGDWWEDTSQAVTAVASAKANALSIQALSQNESQDNMQTATAESVSETAAEEIKRLRNLSRKDI